MAESVGTQKPEDGWVRAAAAPRTEVQSQSSLVTGSLQHYNGELPVLPQLWREIYPNGMRPGSAGGFP